MSLVRSRRMLDAVRGRPCTLRLDGCDGGGETTVACHMRDRHKGMGQKASDLFAVAGCANCHKALDEAKQLTIEHALAMIRAIQETQEMFLEAGVLVIPFPDRAVTIATRKIKPRKPKAERARIPSRPMENASKVKRRWPKKSIR